MTTAFDLSDKKRLLLARLLQNRGVAMESAPQRIPRRAADGPAPLSFAQQRLWFLHQLEPESTAYHIAEAVRLGGALDPETLARALAEVARRHETLRTSFFAVEGEPWQVVHEPGVLPPVLSRVDLSALPEPLRLAEARRVANRLNQRPFDPSRAPLLRAALLRLGPDGHVLALVMHHIVSDGWSMGVLVRELTTLYGSLSSSLSSPLPELPIQYPDFAVWQRGYLQGEVLDGHLRYWKERLAGAPTALALPTDRPWPPVQSARGRREHFAVDRAAAVGLRDLSQRSGASLFMTLLAALGILLQRHTGQDDLLIGSPVANRSRPETEPLIGFFVNTLVLRVELAGDPAVAELLARVRDSVLGADTHQDLPFEKLVDVLELPRDLSRSPLFQVMLAFQNLPGGGASPQEVALSGFGVETGTAQFELQIFVNEGPAGIAGSFDYRTDLFDPPTVRRLARHFETLLREISLQPERRASELPMVGEAERHQVLCEWSDAAALPEPACLHHLFAAQAARTPGATALVVGGERLTYTELDRRADRLAHSLRRLGVGPEVTVGVCLERSADLVAALLAVLKAGGAYVPLDTAYPAERLAFMLEDSRAAVVVTRDELRERLGGKAPRAVLVDRHGGEDDLPLPDSGAAPSHLAYVIYTSGSTGRPKGVAIEHRSAAALVRWAGEVFPDSDLAGVLAATSVCFDLSVFELFVPLSRGGKVVLAANALELPDLPAAAEVTLVNTVPSAMAELARTGGLPASVRTVNLAGEPLRGTLARQVYERSAARRVLNLYGPTEDTTYSTWARVERESGREPSIGRPVAGSRACVLDRTLRPAPLGVPGELCLAGAGLARGYLGRPDLTAERFVPNPLAKPWGEAGARLYRTGDLARHRPDGEIELLGRLDHQVKIRGFRIELGEVEAVLGAHPRVREAVAVAREEAPGDQRLVAYWVPAGEAPVVSELRAYLRERLPEHMVPSVFVALEAFPLTANGKVDRRALPAPDQPAGEAEWLAPRTPVEELLAVIWEQVLGVPRAGLRDHFFELGGHSLLATQVISRIRTSFGVELPLRRVFELPTLAELAAAVEAAMAATVAGQGSVAPPLAPVPRDREIPLSFAQERLWFLQQLDPQSAVYNMPMSLRLEGRLSVPALAAGLEEIVRRHETLRTTLELREAGPVQVIAPPVPALLPLVDLSGLPEAVREAAALGLAAAEAARPFDLSRHPVVRRQLLRLGEEDHALLLAFHHVTGDGWSLGVLTREVAELYDAAANGRAPRLPALPVQYADFAAWQRSWLQGEVLDAQIAWWRDQLSGAPAVLELPADRPRPPVQTYRGARRSRELPAGLVSSLATLGRREGSTLFMTLLAGFDALLHRWTGQDTVVVGSPIANRNRGELEGLIGFFVNTLALRADLGDDPAFRRLLRRVRETALGAYAHQDLPFEKLVDELRPERDMSHAPVFQVLFVFQGTAAAATPPPPSSGLALRPLGEDGGVARYDLTLVAMEQGGSLTLHLDYNTDLFAAATAERMLRLFAHLLEGAAAAPDTAVSGLPLLDETERTEVVLRWNGAQRELAGDLPLHRLFAAQAERAPGAPAVVSEEGTVTYGELRDRAWGLARSLQRLGVGPESRVALCFERSADALAAMLGVMAAGGAYVPLDHEAPRDRLAALVADAGADLLLTHQRLAPALAGLAPQVLAIDADPSDPTDPSDPSDPSDVQISPGNAAYVIYTSGSTGTPKGVVATHRGVVNFVHGLAGAVGLGPGDRLLLFAPLSFDASVLQIFPTLASGAAVVVHRNPRELANHEILGFCERFGVTVLDLPAPLLRPWVEEIAARRLPLPSCLRTFLTGGESVPVARWKTWAGLADRPLSFLSSYGPTEASVTSTVFLTGSGEPAPEGTNLPIGRPLPGTRAYVLDRGMRPVPRGVAGEVFLAGAGLARGYLGRPDLTAPVFVPDPLADEAGETGGRLYRTGDLARWLAGGQLEFLGRADHQVKIRGFRLELVEVEAALQRHPAVREVAVLLREDRPGDKRLVAYLSPREGSELPPVSDLRSFLSASLPQYMVPSAFVSLPALPALASGKVDRAALPAPDATHLPGAGEQVAPRTAGEETLARIWAQVLGVERVGVHDNFFELGGDSILSIQIIARANQAGLYLSPKQLFENQTVAELAGVARLSPVLLAEQGAVSGPVPLTPIVRWFFARDWIDPSWFNSAVMMASAERLDPQALEQALAALLAHHDALRLRAVQEPGGWRLEIAESEASMPFTWIDLRELPAERRPFAAFEATLQAHTGFDLARGPLARLVFYDAGRESGQDDRLLWLMHHLVGDGVSWRILQEDLEAAYRQAAAGRKPELQRKTTSFKAWAERLAAHARSEELRDEAGQWLAAARAPVPPLPLDFAADAGANTLESARAVTVALTPEETQALLQEVPAVYRSQINEALLSALARALAPWTGSAAVRVDLEGHGREPLFDDLDPTRTVGWFTTQYPVLVDVAGASDAGEALVAVKEQLRRIPHNGIGYGLLRGPAEDEEEVARALREAPEPGIGFNYLGQFGAPQASAGSPASTGGGPLLRPTAEPTGPMRHPRSPRTHVLEVSGLVAGGRLQLTFEYSTRLHDRATIERLAEAYAGELRALVARSRTAEDAEEVHLIPSDFPLADLDDSSFRKLSALLDEAE